MSVGMFNRYLPQVSRFNLLAVFSRKSSYWENEPVFTSTKRSLASASTMDYRYRRGKKKLNNTVKQTRVKVIKGREENFWVENSNMQPAAEENFFGVANVLNTSKKGQNNGSKTTTFDLFMNLESNISY